MISSLTIHSAEVRLLTPIMWIMSVLSANMLERDQTETRFPFLAQTGLYLSLVSCEEGSRALQDTFFRSSSSFLLPRWPLGGLLDRNFVALMMGANIKCVFGPILGPLRVWKVLKNIVFYSVFCLSLFSRRHAICGPLGALLGGSLGPLFRWNHFIRWV